MCIATVYDVYLYSIGREPGLGEEAQCSLDSRCFSLGICANIRDSKKKKVLTAHQKPCETLEFFAEGTSNCSIVTVKVIVP